MRTPGVPARALGTVRPPSEARRSGSSGFAASQRLGPHGALNPINSNLDPAKMQELLQSSYVIRSLNVGAQFWCVWIALLLLGPSWSLTKPLSIAELWQSIDDTRHTYSTKNPQKSHKVPDTEAKTALGPASGEMGEQSGRRSPSLAFLGRGFPNPKP